MAGNPHRWCDGCQRHSSGLLHPTAAQHSHASPITLDTTHTPDQKATTSWRRSVHAPPQYLEAAHETQHPSQVGAGRVEVASVKFHVHYPLVCCSVLLYSVLHFGNQVGLVCLIANVTQYLSFENYTNQV